MKKITKFPTKKYQKVSKIGTFQKEYQTFSKQKKYIYKNSKLSNFLQQQQNLKHFQKQNKTFQQKTQEKFQKIKTYYVIFFLIKHFQKKNLTKIKLFN